MAQIKEIFGRLYDKRVPLRNFVLDIFFPIFCIGCGREGKFLCDSCFGAIPVRKNLAGINGEQVDGHLDRVFAACEYGNGSVLNRAIHAFKYDFVKELAEPLSRLLINAAKSERIRVMAGEFVVTAVPLHKKRFCWRGFNQAEMLAKNLCAESGMKMEDLLERVTFSVPQMELSKEERRKNVDGAFVIKSKTVPEKVLLIDDVATTTSTLNACAAALKKAGAKTVFGLVLARVR